MRPTTVPLPVLAVALHTCKTEPQHLNSERIRERFGNCGIDVLSKSGGLRRTNLCSDDGDTRTCRTYAVVQFLEQPQEHTRIEHAQIVDGGSIGAVFKSHGWRIFKQTLYIGCAAVTGEETRLRELMRLDSDAPLAMHVYRLLIEKDDLSVNYATIIEVHHPDYMTEAELRRLYAVNDPALLTDEQAAALVSLVTDSETN